MDFVLFPIIASNSFGSIIIVSNSFGLFIRIDFLIFIFEQLSNLKYDTVSLGFISVFVKFDVDPINRRPDRRPFEPGSISKCCFARVNNGFSRN